MATVAATMPIVPRPTGQPTWPQRGHTPDAANRPVKPAIQPKNGGIIARAMHQQRIARRCECVEAEPLGTLHSQTGA
jgi:hypothetical protein